MAETTQSDQRERRLDFIVFAMAIFPFRKKSKIPGRGKKSGTVSKIAELRSPYVKKPLVPDKFFKRGKRKKILAMPTIKPQTGSKAKHALFIMITLALAGGITYLIGFSHFFDVKSWEIAEDGTKITNDDAMNELLKKQKNKNLVFLNEIQLVNGVKTLHPEFKKIVVKKIFPQKIRIEIEKYSNVANIVNVVQGIQKKFIVDSNGFLTDENIENPELPYIKIFTNEVYSVRTTAVDPDKLNYILEAISGFQEKFTLKILNAEYYVREREIHLQTEKNFMVWIDMQKNLNGQLDKLKKTLSKLNIYNTPLEYIDLRISGTDNEKVIYKTRG